MTRRGNGVEGHDSAFDDLMAGNREYASHFTLNGFDGLAHAGLAMITCMDSRLEPLEMVGLHVGDAKIIRTPGGRLTEDALIGCVLGVHLLNVTRIMLVPHTRCAMATGEDHEIAAQVREATGADVSSMRLGASPDQHGNLVRDVDRLRNHRLVIGRAAVGGFLYDVATGRLDQVV